jgi:hypothetical protein
MPRHVTAWRIPEVSAPSRFEVPAKAEQVTQHTCHFAIEVFPQPGNVSVTYRTIEMCGIEDDDVGKSLVFGDPMNVLAVRKNSFEGFRSDSLLSGFKRVGQRTII